jgi:hypothetical protein
MIVRIQELNFHESIWSLNRLNGLGRRNLIILLKLSLNGFMISHSQELIQNKRVSKRLMPDQFIQKILKTDLLFLNELDVGFRQPTVAFKVRQFGPWIKLCQSIMQSLKIIVISLTNNIQRLELHMIHHVIWEEKCFMNDLVFLDKD